VTRMALCRAHKANAAVSMFVVVPSDELTRPVACSLQIGEAGRRELRPIFRRPEQRLDECVVIAHARPRGRRLDTQPVQHSTGGKSTLGRISKRGNTDLRKLFVQAAQVLMINMRRDRSYLGEWLADIETRRHRSVAIVALANKLVRICWILASGDEYRPHPAGAV
jgi:hypothetical protein